MAKILIVLTNIEKYKTTDRATGLWLGEVTQFYDVVTSAGHEVDFVSPEGGYVPLDPYSFKQAKEVDWEVYNDQMFKTRALGASMEPKQVNSREYQAIYFTGGHGVLWDFPDCSEIASIAATIYDNGGYITSVCHGAAGLINIKYNGDYLIAGKTLTGFTNREERLSKTAKLVPFSTEDQLKSRGAIYKKKRAFKKYVVVDGKLITGQNPNSTKLVAEKLVAYLNE